MTFLGSLKERVRALKRETVALYLAARHPDTPWYAKVFIVGVVAYAVSPIDLIPDFVPVLGLLDDLILIPLGIALALKMVPPAVMAECRARAEASMADAKSGRIAAAVIVAVWVLAVALCLMWASRYF